MSVEQRLTRVEEAIEIMKTLLVSHDERLEDYYKALEESRRDFEFKINALIDSQIKTDMELREMRQSIGEVKESIIEVKESIVELKETSESTLKRLERLENKNGTN
jgi:chromosome segregation ATPase